MKSIRVSLIVYVLVLLLVSLGGVTMLAYRVAAETLDEKEAESRRIIEAECEEREKELRHDLDRSLARKAKLVAARQGRPQRVEWLNALPMFSAPLAPMGYLNLAVDLRLGSPPLSSRLTPVQLRFHENRSLDQFVPNSDDWAASEEGLPMEACQTYFRNGQIWDRTNNLAFHPFTLDESVRQRLGLMQERFDDVAYGSLTLRRVTIKMPRAFVFAPPNMGDRHNPPWKPFFRGPAPPNAGINWRAMQEPYFFVQYAVDTAPLESRLRDLNADRDQRIDRLAQTNRQTLDSLRRRFMIAVGMAALLVCVGGLTLVWRGLAPVHQLSDAVSRINEKDFQLRLDPARLPTELQPVAMRLRESLDQLRQAFAREKQAAQDISHDLRTPLAAITTTLEVALKKDRSPHEYREFLEDCQTSARQMSHLVERLLALAKVDAGNNPLRVRPTDLVAVAQSAVDLVRPLARARDIAIRLDAPEELHVVADSDKIGDILANLLHNAVDYNRDGGRIDLAVQQTDDGVEIEVRDTGVGIRPEAMNRLFERFFRADPARTGETPHCGLGLAIVKSYVDLMKGTIRVHSEPDVGSAFVIRLPLRPIPNPTRFTPALREDAL